MMADKLKRAEDRANAAEERARNAVTSTLGSGGPPSPPGARPLPSIRASYLVLLPPPPSEANPT